MTADLIAYILHHGYLAIFFLVFLQEIGVPNPVPNDFVLLYSGYLAYTGTLHFWAVFFTAVAADLIGTAVVYTVFYFFGKVLLERKPRWLPISRERVEKLTADFSKKGWWGIYLGRLIPYLRGYTSVAAGLLEVKPRIYLLMVFFSAVTWSGGYVLVGKLMGQRWKEVIAMIGGARAVILIIVAIALIFIIRRFLLKRQRDNQF